MRPRLNSIATMLAVLGGLAYPFLVWTALGTVAPWYFVLFGIVCLLVRAVVLHRVHARRMEIGALLLAVLLLAALATLSAELATRAYPVVVSLAVAAMFALSLRTPPSVVERIARIREPDFPPDGVRYTRQVTQVWVGFLLLNAMISAATALWGSLDAWVLWNGLLSYLTMGVLFAAEYGVRHHRRHAMPR